MSAIRGLYAPKRRAYRSWIDRWHVLGRPGRVSTPEDRDLLASQLRVIRNEDGNHEAREFRNYLLWIGIYPVRLR